jgi:beta-glucoside operon transcriptional antiterminator
VNPPDNDPGDFLSIIVLVNKLNNYYIRIVTEEGETWVLRKRHWKYMECHFGKTQVFCLSGWGNRMVIKKIMNNNVVFVEDFTESGGHKELVLVGKGIDFKKKPGQAPDLSRVEKTFTMETHTERNKLAQLLSSISPEDFRLADMIIQYAQTVLGKPLKENIYITLTDHIVYAMERVSQGIAFTNPMNWEIKHFYPQEYSIGLYALDYIKKETGIDMPEGEAGYFAFHIANAHMDTDVPEVEITARIIKAAMRIVSLTYNIHLDEDSLDYGRFVIHLKFCIGRLFAGKMLSQDDEVFINMIKTQYNSAYDCAERIGAYIKQEFGLDLTEDELVYLTVHIKRVTDNQ